MQSARTSGGGLRLARSELFDVGEHLRPSEAQKHQSGLRDPLATPLGYGALRDIAQLRDFDCPAESVDNQIGIHGCQYRTLNKHGSSTLHRPRFSLLYRHAWRRLHTRFGGFFCCLWFRFLDYRGFSHLYSLHHHPGGHEMVPTPAAGSSGEQAKARKGEGEQR